MDSTRVPRRVSRSPASRLTSQSLRQAVLCCTDDSMDRPGSPTQPLFLMSDRHQKIPPPYPWSMLERLRFWGKGSRPRSTSLTSEDPRDSKARNPPSDISCLGASSNNNPPSRPLSNGVAVALPRQPTFNRTQEEQHHNLVPHPSSRSRRARSVGGRAPSRSRSCALPSSSLVSALRSSLQDEGGQYHDGISTPIRSLDDDERSRYEAEYEPALYSDDDSSMGGDDSQDALELEMDQKWILNLSMHFRDHSDKEKFFITYLETPTKWRRVTVSCNYRNAEPDSLEQLLKELYYQRDKGLRIYESIRGSISEIQFYDTVTNLKLETRDGRLHVHVTEDMNEIIQYPSKSIVQHLSPSFVRESEVAFSTHLSGFAYEVKHNGKDYVMKEIPGPDTVDEFLYEANALHALLGSRCVIPFRHIVVDDDMLLVKGLLIDFAEQGALVDLFYDHKGKIEWSRRERWGRHIIEGLAEIHEAGFVQGDFTLSNIVVDAYDNAKIIDINRRGCPVGWEPPEFTAKINNKQRISMFIGIKSDLYQLGMTLWALAMEEDDPGRRKAPYTIPAEMDIPDYFRNIVDICLSSRPQDRLSAKELLTLLPPIKGEATLRGVERPSIPPVNIPEDAADIAEDLPNRNDEYLEQPTNTIPSTSGPCLIPDSEQPLGHHAQSEPHARDSTGSTPNSEAEPTPPTLESENTNVATESKASEIELEFPSDEILSPSFQRRFLIPGSNVASTVPGILVGVGHHSSITIGAGSEQVDEHTMVPYSYTDDGYSRMSRSDTEMTEWTESQRRNLHYGLQRSMHTSCEDLAALPFPIRPATSVTPVSQDSRHLTSDSDTPIPPYPDSPALGGKSSPLQACSLGHLQDLAIPDLPLEDPPKDSRSLLAHYEPCDKLACSKLPINPCFKICPPCDRLCCSRLPINPGFKDPPVLQKNIETSLARVGEQLCGSEPRNRSASEDLLLEDNAESEPIEAGDDLPGSELPQDTLTSEDLLILEKKIETFPTKASDDSAGPRLLQGTLTSEDLLLLEKKIETDPTEASEDLSASSLPHCSKAAEFTGTQHSIMAVTPIYFERDFQLASKDPP
ncbi:hypothetical protein FQN55_007092 [Onygenales sp. PD_40]|nr:hypothetical protein FQN55_007092 [Onygenales sp. PD_40]